MPLRRLASIENDYLQFVDSPNPIPKGSNYKTSQLSTFSSILKNEARKNASCIFADTHPDLASPRVGLAGDVSFTLFLSSLRVRLFCYHALACCFFFMLHGWVLLNSALCQQNAPQDIVLRDLSLLTGRSISNYDLDGIELDNGTKLNWSDIYSIQTNDDRLKSLVSSLSLPLFRMETRMDSGDFAGARRIGLSIRDTFYKKPGRNAQSVALACLLGSLQKKEHEGAVVHLYELLDIHKRNRQLNTKIYDKYKLDLDFESGFCDQLLPVFFDSEKSKTTFDEIQKSYPADESDLQFEYLYRAALAFGSDQKSEGELAISAARKLRTQNAWTDIVAAQGEDTSSIERLSASLTKLDRSKNPPLWTATHFVVARNSLSAMRQDSNSISSGEVDKSILQLLQLPAHDDPAFYELSAASLFVAADFLKSIDRNREAQVLGRELLTRFDGSWHARKWSSETQRK